MEQPGERLRRAVLKGRVMEKIIRWGIIGCGDVVRRKSGGAFNIPGKSRLAGIFVRHDTETVHEFAASLGAEFVTTELGELLSCVDAVYIATPPSSHYEYASRAVEKGKHVLVEKPVAASAGQCTALLAEATLYGARVFPAFYRRALSPYTKIKAWLDAGRIGQVRQVLIDQRKRYPAAENDIPWRLRPEISGGGLFEDIGVHTLDILDYLFGPGEVVDSIYVNQMAHYLPADTVAVLASYGDVRAVGNWHLDSIAEKDEIEILGSAGSIRFSMLTDRPAILETAQGREEAPATEEKWLHAPLVENICDALLSGAEAVSCEGNAQRISLLVEKIQK